jgi:hypothetical protein
MDILFIWSHQTWSKKKNKSKIKLSIGLPWGLAIPSECILKRLKAGNKRVFVAA